MNRVPEADTVADTVRRVQTEWRRSREGMRRVSYALEMSLIGATFGNM